MAAVEHAACCCSFRADEAAAFAVRTYARPQQLHSLESESDDMRGDTSLVLYCLCLARAAPALCSSIGVAWRTAVAAGTGGDGGTNAPRQANAAKSVLSLGGGRLCSTVRLFSQCPQYNFTHAPPVLLLAGNVWPINISTPLNVTLFSQIHSTMLALFHVSYYWFTISKPLCLTSRTPYLEWKKRKEFSNMYINCNFKYLLLSQIVIMLYSYL